MMNRKEFYEYVKDNVKAYLPKSYEEEFSSIRMKAIHVGRQKNLRKNMLPNLEQVSMNLG